jgi:VanZ family protein
MSSTVHQIPEAPVLAAFLVVSLTVMVWRLHREARFTWPRATTGIAACVYGAGVLKEVLQPFQIGIDRRYYPGWRVFVHITPLRGAEPSDLILNALLFLPLGMLLPLLTRVRSARRVTLIGLALSFAIETTQLILDVTVSVGRVADINDLLGDTVGAFIGYVALRLSTRTPALARLAAVLAWTAPHRTAPPQTTASPHAGGPPSSTTSGNGPSND